MAGNPYSLVGDYNNYQFDPTSYVDPSVMPAWLVIGEPINSPYPDLGVSLWYIKETAKTSKARRPIDKIIVGVHVEGLYRLCVELSKALCELRDIKEKQNAQYDTPVPPSPENDAAE